MIKLGIFWGEISLHLPKPQHIPILLESEDPDHTALTFFNIDEPQTKSNLAHKAIDILQADEKLEILEEARKGRERGRLISPSHRIN